MIVLFCLSQCYYDNGRDEWRYYDVTLVAGNRSLYYCNFHGATMTTGGVSGGIMM